MQLLGRKSVMERKKGFMMISFIFFMLIPMTAFAVDYSITNVDIDVHLEEDGQANVVEQHTYQFDSKFNGITRYLIPKEKTSITNVEGYENGTPLKVEKDQWDYKFHRKGKKETVPFEISYTIVNAVEKYEDGAQFYWPFFDDRNESTYENMTITVHPPGEAEDVDYFGYDTAFNTGSLKDDGVVQFQLGHVPSGKNGDIRVIYEPSLFPTAKAKSGTIRPSFQQDVEEVKREREIFLAKQSRWKTLGLTIGVGALALFVSVISMLIIEAKRKKHYVQSLIGEAIVPKNRLSMPATIYFTNGQGMDAHLMSASLLDLMRKGFIEQVEDGVFELRSMTDANAHEAVLIELLFRNMGDGKRYEVAQAEAYVKERENRKQYTELLGQWEQKIAEEVKDAKLSEKKGSLRTTLIIAVLALIPVIVMLARYEIYAFMTLCIGAAVGLLVIAVGYYPVNAEGILIKEEWKQFRRQFKMMDHNAWQDLSANDKYRAYIYSIGVKDGEALYATFIKDEMENKDLRHHMFYAYHPASAVGAFTVANQKVYGSTDGSTTSPTSSGGGGVGGGGGGSGAF